MSRYDIIIIFLCEWFSVVLIFRRDLQAGEELIRVGY